MAIAQVANPNNPVGLIVSCILGVTAVMLLIGFYMNHRKGKRGLNAVPGIDALRSRVGGCVVVRVCERGF